MGGGSISRVRRQSGGDGLFGCVGSAVGRGSPAGSAARGTGTDDANVTLQGRSSASTHMSARALLFGGARHPPNTPHGLLPGWGGKPMLGKDLFCPVKSWGGLIY